MPNRTPSLRRLKVGMRNLIPAFAAWAILVSAAAGETTPVFTLDTRDVMNAVSGLFTLDTRDPDTGAVSSLFTLDTRGEVLPVSPVFALDTRGLEATYAPENVSVTALQATVAELTWEYAGNPLGFVVDRRVPLGTWDSVTVSGGAVRNWQDTAVQAGQFYEYRVAAVLAGGVATYSDIVYLQMPSLPAAPSDLTATAQGAGAVALAWQDHSANEDGFEIWRRTGMAGDWIYLAGAAEDATGLVDDAASPVTYYAYEVRATNRWGSSAFSAVASVTTPDDGGGCGYDLQVIDAALTLDGTVADLAATNPVSRRALVAGELQASIRSPPGQTQPVRVVLGFRDDQGQAVAEPVELVDFYTVPGCPGIAIHTLVPENFLGPAAGTNTLWLEMIMANRDPIEAFTTEHHTQEAPMRKKICAVAVRPGDFAGVRVRLVPVEAVAGTAVDVPVELVSTGGEFEVAFSVTSGAGLQWTGTELGADALTGLLQVQTNGTGAVGIVLQAPLENPLAAGTKHILTLHYDAEQPGEQAVSFGDEPVARDVVGSGSSPGGVVWEDGHVTVAAAGLEGDVSPRPQGDGAVDEQDVRLARQFALGVLPVPDDPAEFQRLDCAPVATCGDGAIDMADAVAIQHYVNGQEPLRAACGPMAPAEGGGPAALAARSTPRHLVLVAPEEAERGDTVQVAIDLAAQGNEHGLGASVAFDPDVLACRSLQPAGAATNADFLPNLDNIAAGRLAFGMTLPGTNVFAAGTQTVVEIEFAVLEGAGSTATVLDFASAPAECQVVDAASAPLEAAWDGAVMDILAPEAADAPPAPSTGTAEAIATNQIKVSWTPVTWATGYRVRRKAAGETVWTRLADCEVTRTVLVDSGLPAGTLCDYLVTALNPQGVESAAIRLQAWTWTALEGWRQTWFGQTANLGQAADGADPDEDDLPNLVEYQLGRNPLVADGQAFRFAAEEVFAGLESWTVLYALPEAAPGGIYFEFTDNLLTPVPWRNDGLAPVSQQPDGAVEWIKVRLPETVTTNRMLFLRMKAE